jgi:hypothetical protein
MTPTTIAETASTPSFSAVVEGVTLNSDSSGERAVLSQWTTIESRAAALSRFYLGKTSRPSSLP